MKVEIIQLNIALNTTDNTFAKVETAKHCVRPGHQGGNHQLPADAPGVVSAPTRLVPSSQPLCQGLRARSAVSRFHQPGKEQAVQLSPVEPEDYLQVRAFFTRRFVNFFWVASL